MSGSALLFWAIAVLLTRSAGSAAAAEPGHADHAGHGTAPAAPRSVRTTMEALHASGGVPPGWQFTLPPGDPQAGRRVFVDFKCYACHAIRGEQFPLKAGESASAGPDLTGMAPHHPIAYLVESIVNPHAVLVEGPGFIGGDGRSIMPPSPDMTVAQLTDLIAYLQSAGAPEPAVEQRQEQTAGGYRVRLVFRPGGSGGHDQHAQHQHDGAAAPTRGRGRLIAIVTDVASGQPIPYLPVTARVEAAGTAARTVRLAPAFAGDGLQYGAEVALPAKTRKITLSLGRAALRIEAGAPAQLGREQTVAFDWK